MEVLGDEDGPAMTDLVWFRRHGICVVRLMTDKAVAYAATPFRPGARHSACAISARAPTDPTCRPNEQETSAERLEAELQPEGFCSYFQ